ncbi:MAG: bifunctional riboflavin kinase/FAD synthetase, partial [Elusimicrobia bacterium]|nr:bifunctional riboflavin kinase/FAD synthetase [Elusimicrobiota bacterium]MBD3412477.1 bifunctional riboflavin kinase/FAD synthetase [Elusimicrobiota bacterium]
RMLCEVHVLSGTVHLYGKKVTVVLLKKLRQERHYKHPGHLIRQVNQDIKKARKFFRQTVTFSC